MRQASRLTGFWAGGCVPNITYQYMKIFVIIVGANSKFVIRKNLPEPDQLYLNNPSGNVH